MGTGVVSFVVDVTVVHAGAGKRSLVDKQGAATGAVSGATWRRVLVETPKCDGGNVQEQNIFHNKQIWKSVMKYLGWYS